MGGARPQGGSVPPLPQQEQLPPSRPVQFDKIHMVLGEGNFVLLVSEGSFLGTPSTFYDLFRVESGRIAEHWDVIEPVPAKETWKNNNGKF